MQKEFKSNLDLFTICKENEIDYISLSKELYFKNREQHTGNFDISVIVPVRGRMEFQKPVLDHLQASIKRSGLRVAVTYVEHSVVSEYLRQTTCNFIWVPCNSDSQFNKCLCFNIGFLHGPKAEYYMFYDADLVCKYDFFDHVFDGLSPAAQTFKGKRVLYANKTLTEKILLGAVYDDFLNDKHSDITIGQPGAPGGSLLVSKVLFENVGGYDAELFHGYSVEDQFFFNKLSMYTMVRSMNTIDLVHLDHGGGDQKTNYMHMSMLVTFNAMNHDDKIKFIEFRKEAFKSLIK